jgi:enterochelin esterase-like enzyme
MKDPNELTVVSPGFIGALILLAGIVWWVALRHRWRRDRPRWANVMLVFTAGLLSLTVVASAVNAYFSYLPKVRDVLDVVAAANPPDATKAIYTEAGEPHPHGQIVRLRVPDNGSGFGKSGALVWLPPQYFTQPSARFKVAYLFHGSPGVPKDWYRGGEADQIGLSLAREGMPAILVAPRLSKGWLDDPECVDGVHEKVESHVLLDVIPTVDTMLRTIANRDGRIFAGMSAGGYCALNLGLRNRDVVSTVLNLSGLAKPTHAGGLSALFGLSGTAQARDNSPAVYAASLPRDPYTRVWLDCGSSDHQVRGQMQSLAPVLRERGLVVQERIRPGEHTFSVWRPALRESLAWALAPTPTPTPTPTPAAVARLGHMAA